MQTTIVKPVAAAALALSLAGGLAACTVQPYRHGPPPPVYVQGWYPYDYFYYPGAQVYFNISTGYYWYPDRGRWVRSYQLPPRLVVLPRDRVRIRVDRDEPWRHHQEHVQQYRPRLAPQEYQRPQARDRNREEREHNQQLHREYRERHEPRDPKGDRYPERR